MKKFESYCEKAAKGMNYIAAAGLFFIMLIVVLNILSRAIFGYTFAGTYELVQYTILLVVSLALSHNEFDNGNIVITFFIERMKPKTANILFIIMYFVGICGVSAVIYNQFKVILVKYANKAVTGVLLIPHWIIVIVLTLGFCCLLLTIILKLVRFITTHKSLPESRAAAESN